MWLETKQKVKSQRLWYIYALIVVFFLVYFSYHIGAGEYGLFSRSHIQQQIEEGLVKQKQLRAEIALWEQRVNLLRGDVLDLDILNEHLRRSNNLARRNELIVILPEY